MTFSVPHCGVTGVNGGSCWFPGGNKVIDVIDVARQADSKMKLSEFIKYYTGDQRPKVLNLISLEFSDTRWVYERDTEYPLSQLFFDPLSGSVDLCHVFLCRG